LGYFFHISATAEASDFTFGTKLGFTKAIIKLHPEEKWAWPWVRGAPQNLRFPFNISATTEVSDFKIGRLVGFVKPHHKISLRKKEGVALG